jgi:hypothetical protein
MIASRYWRCHCGYECANAPEMIAHLETHGITREQIEFWSHDEWRLRCSS